MPSNVTAICRLASVLIALAAIALLPAPTHAGSGEQELSLENLTWPQIAHRLKSGTTAIIIPTGGTEQNGRHMILGKHNYIVAQTARRIAKRVGNTLIAPVMAYVPEGDAGKKTGHMAFPGTISLTPALFEGVLEQAALSFKTHGFKTIVFLGDSGGNQVSQQRVATRLSKAWRGEGVSVIHLSDYYAKNGGDDLLIKRGHAKAKIGTHAGIRDTAELMAVFPQGVDLKNAVADTDGANGDATHATKELGELLLNAKVDAAVKQLKLEMRTVENEGDVGKTEPPGILKWLYRAIFG